MKIIEPSFSLFTSTGKPLTPDDGVQMLRWIETNARISHRSEFGQTDTSWQRFIQAVVLEHGDMSVVEHASLTAIIRTDRGVTHELVRHRLFSFTQESTRFVNYQKKGEIEVIRPNGLDSDKELVWHDSVAAATTAYMNLTAAKIAPQVSRSVLPNALASTISMTGNLRNWRHFFLMRTTKESHPDMRRISIPMLGEVQRCIPMFFADIIPNDRQVENLRKAR